jgi:hypothetical protein
MDSTRGMEEEGSARLPPPLLRLLGSAAAAAAAATAAASAPDVMSEPAAAMVAVRTGMRVPATAARLAAVARDSGPPGPKRKASMSYQLSAS